MALYSGWDDVVVLGAGAVLVATVSGSQALEAASGAPRWTFPGSTMYPPAVPLDDGTVLLATEQGVISRVEPGRRPHGVAGQPGHAGAERGPGRGRGQRLGRLRTRVARPGAAPDGGLAGSVRFTRAHCYSAPAVAGDTLVTGDQDGVVHGIRLVS